MTNDHRPEDSPPAVPPLSGRGAVGRWFLKVFGDAPEGILPPSAPDEPLPREVEVSVRAEDAPPVGAVAPPVEPGERVLEARLVRPPHGLVRIVHDPERSADRYEVVEPALDEGEASALAFVKDAFLRTLEVDLDTLDEDGAHAYLVDSFRAIVERYRLSLDEGSWDRVAYYLERDFLGFGPLDVIMHDPNVEDVSCDGPVLPIFVHHRAHGSIRSNVRFGSDEELDAFVIQLVQRSGKHISVAEPLVDATLPDGSRLQASLSREVTTRGSSFTIRRFREDPLTASDLLENGTASPEMMAYLWLAVENGASALICGGTASGKTTTLNALSLFIPPEKKIVTIEDTREISLLHDNWIAGVTRTGGSSASDGRRIGEVDMFDLLRAALRQRPEYLLVGEIRGREAFVLFQAMATGHTVYSTMHADSVPSAVYRLESKPLEVPRMMLSALDVVMVQSQVRVGDRRVRKLREVVELTGIDPQTGELLTNRVFHWDPSTDRFVYSGSSHILQRVAEELNLPSGRLQEEFDRRLELLRAMQEKGMRDIGSVSHVLATFAIDPERARREIREAPHGT